MSTNERTFLYWFTFIAASLIITSAMGLIGMYRGLGVVDEKVTGQEQRLTTLYNYHNRDVEVIRFDLREIRDDQKEIRKDVGLILKKVE